MWFVFGFISLISFSVYFGLRRRADYWKGEPITVSGYAGRYGSKTFADQTTNVYIETQAVDQVDFSIKPETGIDRFFKWLGVSVEHQVGCDDFDQKYYLIGEQSAVCDLLATNKEIRTLIDELLTYCQELGVKLLALNMRHGRLWLDLKPNDEAPADHLATTLLPFLGQLSGLLKSELNPRKAHFKDPFIFSAAIILAISTGMALAGGLNLFRIGVTHIPFLIDPASLVKASLFLGTLLLILLIGVTFVYLGRTARTHLVLIELLLVGYFGAVSSSFVLLRDFNIDFDSTAPQIHEVRLKDKTVRHRSKASHYSLYLTDWTDNRGNKRIKVSSSLYNQFEVGQRVHVYQKSGFLGFSWVAEIKAAD